MSQLEELIEEINVDKEIISTLPQNNKRNQKLFLEKIEELSLKYKEYEKDIINEISLRSRKYDGFKIGVEVNKLENELLNLESVFYLINEVDSSFEKMNLDREISNLTYYYKKSLDKVNNTIYYCLRKFEEVGITLNIKDFFFNQYVTEYMTIIFRNLENKEMNLSKIDKKFEEIYWKCPEIITYIEMNIRYLYLKNEKNIDKYYKNQKEKLLKKFSEDTIKNTYEEMKKTTIETKKRDKSILIKDFLDGKLKAKDYSKDSIRTLLERFYNKKDITDEEENNLLINLIKLLNSVKEFKNYNEFKFIIDDAKKIYSEKEQHKGEYAKLKKEISQKEAKVIKLGKPNIFKKFSDKNLAEQTKLVKELKDLYKKLDLAEVSDKITTTFSDNTTLYEVLYLASSYYKYLFNCIIENDKDIEEEAIFEKINKIKEFINWPYFTILNNIVISEEKDILYIVKDRYNLLNINVSKEDLDPDNLNSLIEVLEKCEKYYYLKENNIDVQDLENVFEFKKIINNK